MSEPSLTDEEIRRIDDATHFHESPDWSVRFARAILAASATDLPSAESLASPAVTMPQGLTDGEKRAFMLGAAAALGALGKDQRQVREDSQGLGEPGRLSPTSGAEAVASTVWNGDDVCAAIRKVGGIVHSDGNIFFTNWGRFLAAVDALARTSGVALGEGSKK